MEMYNLHTHTSRCMHAIGTDEEYVKSAIKNGYSLLGFSDHVPHIFPNSYKSHMRMTPSQADDYLSSINSLKEKYSDKIDILKGYEMEYYPELFNDDIDFLEKKGYDYLILAQHFLNNEYEEPGFIYVGKITTKKEIIDQYVNQLLEGARTGKFLYVAHPDLVNFIGNEKHYLEQMDYLLRELKKLDLPIEYNMLGYTDKRHYPNPIFWNLAKEIKNDVIIGIDAHDPKAFNDIKSLEEAKDYLASINMKILTKQEVLERINNG